MEIENPLLACYQSQLTAIRLHSMGLRGHDMNLWFCGVLKTPGCGFLILFCSLHSQELSGILFLKQYRGKC